MSKPMQHPPRPSGIKGVPEPKRGPPPPRQNPGTPLIPREKPEGSTATLFRERGTAHTMGRGFGPIFSFNNQYTTQRRK